MKNKLKRTVLTLLMVTMLGIPCVVSAASVQNGELNFTGGQTGSVVYSDIRDAKPRNSIYYKVIAKVKVGGNTYTSGWKNDKAYVQHERHWYTNEHAYYDCYRR